MLLKLAILFTPPKIIKLNNIANNAAVTFGLSPKAISRLAPIEFACTPGSNNPQEKIVTIANNHAYHFTPKPFSI
ncbi:hypothetical protein D3C76_1293250 [compost metagenome]